MEYVSSAKSLVGKLQPNIESLDKNWIFFFSPFFCGLVLSLSAAAGVTGSLERVTTFIF